MCWPTKGHDKLTAPIRVATIEVTPSGKRPKFSLPLVHLDSDYLKEWVHSRIRWPKESRGGWHLHSEMDEDYCRQVVNEARTRKPGGGYTWVARGRAHDYLDAEAMAYAAAKMIGLDRIPDQFRKPEQAPPPPETPAAAAAPPPATQRPQGSWLGNRTNNWLRR
jgi:hypothetical protein